MLANIRRFSSLTRAITIEKKPTKVLDEVPQYKSIYSLDKIYPKSSLNLAARVEPPKTEDRFSGFIPLDRLKITYMRSGKPGGQNVNKTDSQAVVTFKLSEADWIPSEVRKRLGELHHNSINKEGEWIIRSQKTRHASLNLADCLDKLRTYIAEVEEKIEPPPDPVTLEMRRQQYERAAQNRLKQKRSRSAYLKLKNVSLNGN